VLLVSPRNTGKVPQNTSGHFRPYPLKISM
jgi:hypothetical protein